MTINLTTIGSRNVTVDIGPSALSESGPGGVAVEFGLFDGPLIFTLTAQEARQLVAAITAQLDGGPSPA